MPNVTAMEPQILVDLLALAVEDAQMRAGGNPTVAVISPWLSDVELTLYPSNRHGALGGGSETAQLGFAQCLERLCTLGCDVSVGVLKYGEAVSGLRKEPEKFARERSVLRGLLIAGARIYLCPNLHAKGVVTDLGLLTGSTNYTRSGLHLQMQNTNYFPHDHPEFRSNRSTLLGYLSPEFLVTDVP